MPMTWDAQADAKLLQAIIKVYSVKAAGEKLAEVAEMMGPDCTPKALTHRISKLKNLANTGALSGTGAGEKVAAPKAKKAAKPGAGGKKRRRGGVSGGDDSDGEEVDEDDEETVSGSSGKGKGRKRKASAAAEAREAGEVLKKIKAENEGDEEVGEFDHF